MRPKTLTVLLIVLMVMAAATVATLYLNAPERREGRLGECLFAGLPVNNIARINIEGPKHAISLVKKKDLWVVEDRFDYPADFSLIVDLARKLKDVNVGQQFKGSEDVLGRLCLKDPNDKNAPADEKAIRLIMKDETGKELARILFGKKRTPAPGSVSSPGQYVRLGGSSMVYLINSSFPSLNKKQEEWLDHTLTDVNRDDVKKILCIRSKGKKKILFGLERPNRGTDFKLVGFHSTKKAKKHILNRVAGALSYLRMEDVLDPSVDPASLGLDLDTCLEYYLFNGIIYRAYTCKKCPEADRCYLKLEVDYQEPPSGEDPGEKGDSNESNKKEKEGEGNGAGKSPEEWKLEAKRIDERLSPWIYVISKGRYDSFIMDQNKFFK